MTHQKEREFSTASLRDELDRERAARLSAVEEAARQQLMAQTLERLATTVYVGGSLDSYLQQLLEAFVSTTKVDVAVICTRESDRLAPRAAVGLEKEFCSGFSVPLEDTLDGRIIAEHGPIQITHAAVDLRLKCEALRNCGVCAWYCLGIRDGDRVVGMLFIGSRTDSDFLAEQKHLLSILAIRATMATKSHSTQMVLQQALRSRDEVLAVVAHDLRNPISVIAMAAQSLLKRLPDSAMRRPVERIVRGANRADRLIQDLLEVDAIEAGRFSIDTRTLDMADVVLAALESQQSLAASASVIIAPDLFPELLPIEGDEERLLEVLENLIGNAIKFTRPGGTVTVSANVSTDQIVVSVSDTGSGIAPDHLPHLFDRFWQASKSDRRGTGLGLTICKAIVEAHGGRIGAESEPGIGTKVSFTLPVAVSSRRRTTEATGIANVLLIDDRPENLMSLKAILERPEYRLVTAQSGEEALKLALQTKFSVALIDVAMPGMNGLEVAFHLKELERSRDIPIIFVTAFGEDPEEIHRAYSAGAADYLVKPLDPEIVRKKVAVFVGLSRRRQVMENQQNYGTTPS